MGLDGLLNTRSADLVGIVNGIDTDHWDPGDRQAARRQLHGAHHQEPRRQPPRHRGTLRARSGRRGPPLCVVSRLTRQKGIDIPAATGEQIVATGARLVALGAGDPALEGALLAGASRHRGRRRRRYRLRRGAVAFMQGKATPFSSRRVSSLAAPPALRPAIWLRAGRCPHRRVGRDTVIDANEAAVTAGVATGFQFTADDADAFAHAIRRAAVSIPGQACVDLPCRSRG